MAIVTMYMEPGMTNELAVRVESKLIDEVRKLRAENQTLRKKNVTAAEMKRQTFAFGRKKKK